MDPVLSPASKPNRLHFLLHQVVHIDEVLFFGDVVRMDAFRQHGRVSLLLLLFLDDESGQLPLRRVGVGGRSDCWDDLIEEGEDFHLLDLAQFQVLREELADLRLGQIAEPFLLPDPLLESLKRHGLELAETYVLCVEELIDEYVCDVLEL